MQRIFISVVFLGVFFGLQQDIFAETWRAGSASARITPDEFMWMAGYASRDRPADGKVTELYSKALVLESANNTRAVIITLDLVGIDRELSNEVRELIETRFSIPAAQVLLCCSHTHSGPVVKRNLGPLHYYRLDQSQRTQIERYADKLRDTIVQVVGQAMSRMEPSSLAWGVGQTNFAVNRRSNKEPDGPKLRTLGQLAGPSDHDVPVLAVRNTKGDLTSILFGYACHATVLSDLQWSGDYPGYAQTELETRHPGCVALFFAGCGADQNPIPRRTVELASHYGRQLASAVDQTLLTTEMKIAAPSLSCKYREIDLAFDKLPTTEELRTQAASGSLYESLRAKQLLEGIDLGKPLPTSYPYPISLWQIGADLNLVALGGEVVVDYSLRIKGKMPKATFVAGYAHDVMAYIPSYRVLKEGGYEGGGAMVYYGLPAIWADQVEENIVDEVLRQEADLGSR
jgi:neutral ceramidase